MTVKGNWPVWWVLGFWKRMSPKWKRVRYFGCGTNIFVVLTLVHEVRMFVYLLVYLLYSFCFTSEAAAKRVLSGQISLVPFHVMVMMLVKCVFLKIHRTVSSLHVSWCFFFLSCSFFLWAYFMLDHLQEHTGGWGGGNVGLLKGKFACILSRMKTNEELQLVVSPLSCLFSCLVFFCCSTCLPLISEVYL